jgi:hypothetical protein
MAEALEQLVRLETSVLLAEQVSRERFAAREREVLIRAAMEEVLICSTHTHTHIHVLAASVAALDEQTRARETQVGAASVVSHFSKP